MMLFADTFAIPEHSCSPGGYAENRIPTFLVGFFFIHRILAFPGFVNNIYQGISSFRPFVSAPCRQ